MADLLTRASLALDVLLGRAFVTGDSAVSTFDSGYGRSTDDNQAGQYLTTSGAVYACVTMRADLLASLPLKLYKTNARDERTEITQGNLFNLLQSVNPFWTFKRLIKMTEISLGLWGQAFWFVERGVNGKSVPREIWWARSDRVRVIPDKTNYIRGFALTPIDGSQPIFFTPDEVIWFRYPNPNDEFGGLAPLQSARFAADFAQDAWRSNRLIFKNGLTMAGAMFPPKGQTFSEDQAKALERAIETRFKGVDKSHRFGVFRYEGQIQQYGITAKDAQFVEGLQISLEEISRVYRIPLDLMGGQRTYANVDASWKMIWTNAIIPEADILSDELDEQLLPMFGSEADTVEFDSSKIAVLQQSESDLWTREKEQIEKGAITINEWRKEKGLDFVKWGDVFWAQGSLVPIVDGEPKPIPEPLQLAPPKEDTPAKDAPRVYSKRTIEYGSAQHQRLFAEFVRSTEAREKVFGKVVAELFKRQRKSILDQAPERSKRDIADLAKNPFDLKRWIKEFRLVIRPALKNILQDVGDEALKSLGTDVAFSVSEPAIVRFLEQRAQRFATSVNQTTWDKLKKSLSDGLDSGENLDKLIARVEAVMDERIQSSGEVIARTEIIGAVNGGTLEAWKQSEVVKGKEWLAALDDRTREAHATAHGQQVGMDEPFEVDGESLMFPGDASGSAANVIQCRCTMLAVLE